MSILGVNGLFTPVKSPNRNTDQLLFLLNKKYSIPTTEFKYHFTDVIDTYKERIEIHHATKLMNVVKEGDSVFAHSDGARIVWRACSLGAKFTNIYLMGAACEMNIVFPVDCCKGKIYNFYNPYDRILALTVLLIGNDMGRLGKYGSNNPDSGITNINAYDMMQTHSFWGHADYFDESNVDAFGKFIADTFNKSLR